MSGRRRWDGRETLRGIGTEVRRGSGAPIVGYSGRLVPRLSGIQLAAASDGIDIRNNGDFGEDPKQLRGVKTRGRQPKHRHKAVPSAVGHVGEYHDSLSYY